MSAIIPKLTPKQREFLLSLDDAEHSGFWACCSSERRTALSLSKRGYGETSEPHYGGTFLFKTSDNGKKVIRELQAQPDGGV